MMFMFAAAAAAGTKVANGVLLGTSVGGGMVYIEPGTVSY
jgi:hypothetical protein